jgi:hypothetical protein
MPARAARRGSSWTPAASPEESHARRRVERPDHGCAAAHLVP